MAKKIIVVDFGHGGKDPGALAKNGMLEKRVNFNVGKWAVEHLRAAGFEVHTTHDTADDATLSPSQRAAIANRLKADLLISIHHNAGGGVGYDVIYSVKEGLSKKLAVLMADEFKKLGQREHKVYKRTSTSNPTLDYYGIMRAAKMPSVITEFAFLDTIDVEKVDTLKEQWKEAEAIVAAVKLLFN